MFIIILVAIFFIAVDIVLALALCKAAGKEEEIYYNNKEMIKDGKTDK